MQPEQPVGEPTYLMGGEIDRAFFALSIHDENLDPDAISELLEISPTSAYRKGDLSANGKYKHRTGSWDLESGEKNCRDSDVGCEALFADWVETLPDDEIVWAKIVEQYEVKVLMALYMKTWNREFDIHPKSLYKLGRLGIRLHVDTYYEGQEGLGK